MQDRGGLDSRLYNLFALSSGCWSFGNAEDDSPHLSDANWK